MAMTIHLLAHLSDGDLTAEVARLACSARRTTADLIAHLAEFEARRLHLAAGFESLFLYCTQVLRLSEHEAYNRIEAARLARRYPQILELLANGAVTLTTVRLLSPHLTDENHEHLLTAASGLRKNDVEKLIARYFPKPDVAFMIRKVPVPRSDTVFRSPGGARAAGNGIREVASSGEISARPGSGVGWDPRSVEDTSGDSLLVLAPIPALVPPRRREVVRPLAEDRYEIRFTASAATCEKLEAAKDLLRHAVPGGETGEIIERALTSLLEELARKKYAATSRPRTGSEASGSFGSSSPSEASSRHIPASVKRAVWARDGGRCAFVAGNGRRCDGHGFIEFHHVHPYAVGGPPTTGNIELRCRAHNAYEADLFYGDLERPEDASTRTDDHAPAQLVPEQAGSDPKQASILRGAPAPLRQEDERSRVGGKGRGKEPRPAYPTLVFS
jgi:hypothetical protein